MAIANSLNGRKMLMELSLDFNGIDDEGIIMVFQLFYHLIYLDLEGNTVSNDLKIACYDKFKSIFKDGIIIF